LYRIGRNEVANGPGSNLTAAIWNVAPVVVMIVFVWFAVLRKNELG
jgi:hypothetical protein